jgi:hypothetical protein
VAVYIAKLRLCSFKILAQKDGSVWHTGLVLEKNSIPVRTDTAGRENKL